jgi:di/tricarboxylate transporter
MLEWEGLLSLGITLAVLLILIFSRVAPHYVMMGALTVLSVSGILTSADALIGFSNSGLITVAAMFVVAAGIHASGGVDLLVNKVMGNPVNERTALLRVFIPVAFLSAFLNNTPVVATMIPAIKSWSKKINISSSKLMIPLSYAAILGGTITLVGTSTNLIVNGQYQLLTGNPGFSLFDITLVGLPAALSGMLFIYCFFPHWLPDYKDENPFKNLREFTVEVSVKKNGPLVGKSIRTAGLRNLRRLYLVEIQRASATLSAVSPEEILCESDNLVFAGDTEAITELLNIKGLESSGSVEQRKAADALNHLVEVVVSPHCGAIGEAIKETNFRQRYGASIVAIARNGERIRGNLGTTLLQAGDTLLLETRPSFISRQKYNKDFLLVSEIDYAKPQHEKAGLAWLILVGAIVVAGLDLISMLNAALIAAALMLLTGCLKPQQAERSLDLSVLITIAASFALGMALQNTGVARVLADQIVTWSSGDAIILLILTYIFVSILTEVITNNAAALLMMPIVMEITHSASLNPVPFTLAIMMAASASFATPLGYQTNLMVYGPGNYRFTDFLKVGLPMNIFMAIVVLLLLIAIYPLT